MLRVFQVLLDFLLIGSASILAAFVRDNLSGLSGMGVYIAVTLGLAAVADIAFGLNPGIRRFAELADALRPTFASAVTGVVPMVLGLGIDRLEGTSRALPVLQGLAILGGLAGARMAARLGHRLGQRGESDEESVSSDEIATILVVGPGDPADVHGRAIEATGGLCVSIAGAFGPNGALDGRFIGQHPLGAVEDISGILLDLGTRGVTIDRIVVTEPLSRLSPRVVSMLLTIESTSDVRLDFLAPTAGRSASG